MNFLVEPNITIERFLKLNPGLTKEYLLANKAIDECCHGFEKEANCNGTECCDCPFSTPNNPRFVEWIGVDSPKNSKTKFIVGGVLLAGALAYWRFR